MCLNVVVGVECKRHNSSYSKMSKAEQSWSAGAELINSDGIGAGHEKGNGEGD